MNFIILLCTVCSVTLAHHCETAGHSSEDLSVETDSTEELPNHHLQHPQKYSMSGHDLLSDGVEPLVRNKRQSANIAADLSLNHSKPVGRPNFRLDLNGGGKNFKNYKAQGGIGVGTTLWNSRNKKHSLGAAAYASQQRVRVPGFRFNSKPDVGVGIGYKFKFR